MWHHRIKLITKFVNTEEARRVQQVEQYEDYISNPLLYSWVRLDKCLVFYLMVWPCCLSFLRPYSLTNLSYLEKKNIICFAICVFEAFWYRQMLAMIFSKFRYRRWKLYARKFVQIKDETLNQWLYQLFGASVF